MQFLHFNPSQSAEQTSLLSIMLAPNMVASYITTGNKHKMTAPHKGTVLWGSMDVCPNSTLARQLRLSVKNIGTNEHHVRAMKPRQPGATEGMFAFCFWCNCQRFRRNNDFISSTEDILKPHSTKTISLLWLQFALHCYAHAFIHSDGYSGVSHHL